MLLLLVGHAANLINYNICVCVVCITHSLQNPHPIRLKSRKMRERLIAIMVSKKNFRDALPIINSCIELYYHSDTSINNQKVR